MSWRHRELTRWSAGRGHQCRFVRRQWRRRTDCAIHQTVHDRA